MLNAWQILLVLFKKVLYHITDNMKLARQG